MTVRSHGRIHVTIWRDRDFVALSGSAQRTFMQLLSQKDITNCGVLPLMVGRWAKGCREVTEASIRADLVELQQGRFVVVDVDTEEVLIRTFMRNDGITKQPNILKNALRMAETVDSDAIRKVLADELRKTRRNDAGEVADSIDPGDIGNPFETLPEGFANPSRTLKGFETLREGCGDGDGDSYVQGSTSSVESDDDSRARETSSSFSDGTPIPPEPADRWDVPTEIGTAARPTPPMASSSARSTVRLTLGHAGYPDTTINQLAIQVSKLAGKHPPDLIAEALAEWDRRPDVKPQFLPTVLGDVVKAHRAKTPGQGAASTKAAGWLALADQLPPDPNHDHFEQRAIQ